MFADDTAHTLEDIQDITRVFAISAHDFRLQIDMKKNEEPHQPAPQTSPKQRRSFCRLSSQHVTSLSSFGSTVTYSNRLDVELQRRMARASPAFRWLMERLWKNLNVLVKGEMLVIQSYCYFDFIVRCRELDYLQGPDEETLCVHHESLAI